MTISPEEARRLADEVFEDSEQGKTPAFGPIGPGSTIGRYSLEGLIAVGGMGAVYRATHEHPTRVVALKLVRPELLSSSAVRRFQHETELLGRLQHPGIAQIFEADSVRTDLGDQPYFAMEFVEGKPLLDYADEAELSTRDRLRLFLKVCDAVEHAHRKGVIHRDLKPGNVLVTDEGEPKILDFGVAKATDADVQSTTLRTDVGQLVGTLPYMSPEQAGGDAADLDTRSDVYSLGVLLYHLLSGRLPYEIKKSAIPESLRAIQQEDPAPLSGIDKTLRGDIETIVGKALEKDRDRRYQGASELAGDIRRYLASEPITARPASAWYQVNRFARRNRGVVIAGGAVVIALVMGIAGTTGGMLWALGQKERAEEADQATQRELARVTEVKRLITEMLAGVSPDKAQGEDVTLLRRILDETGERLTSGEIEDELIAAELHSTIGVVYRKLGFYPEADRHLPVAMEIRSRKLGDEHADSLSSLNNVAILYSAQNRYDEAQSLWEKALRVKRRVLGEDHLSTLVTMNNLANLYADLGRYTHAEPLYLEAIESRARILGEAHPKTMTTRGNLANLYRRQERRDEAESLLLQSMEILTRELGEGHSSTLVVMNKLAVVYFEQQRYDEAEALHLRTLEIQRRVLGEEHPETLSSMNNLAMLYSEQGQYAKAEPLYVKTLEIRKRTLGEEHLQTLSTVANLGIFYNSTGDFEGAREAFETSLPVFRRVLGESHGWTELAMRSLAEAYLGLEQPAEALELYRESLQIQLDAADHPNATASALNRAAGKLLTHRFEELHDYARALTLANRACTLEEAAGGQRLWFYLDTLALALFRTGDTANAINAQKRAISFIPQSATEEERYELMDNLETYESAIEMSNENGQSGGES